MPLDSSIPFQSMAPDPMVSLNSMLDMGVKSLSLQKNRATFDADVARSKAESSTAQSGAEVNRANIQPLIQQQAAQTSTTESGAFVANANRGSAVQQATANASTATTGANSAAVDLNNKKTQNALQAVQSVMQNPNFNATGDQPYDPVKGHQDVAALISYMRKTGQDSDKIDTLEPLMYQAAETKGGMAEFMRQRLAQGLSPDRAASSMNPENQYVDDGAIKTPVPANAMSPGFNRAASQARVVNKPGPTQSTINSAGQQGIIGAAQAQPGDLGSPQAMPTNERDSAIGRVNGDIRALTRELNSTQNPESRQILNQELRKAQAQLQAANQMPVQPAVAKPTPGFMPTSLPPGQTDSIAATQKGINDHYKGLQDGAATAAQDIGVLQNIISHAKGAATGVGAEKTALAQAIFGKIGITKSQESTVDYDLLAKNSAMLQLAGGDTNLAKTLAGAANPNSHMSEEAIRQAAHQIIGQKKMAIEGLKMFTPLKDMSNNGHPEAYNAMLPKFMAASDPRILQLSGMSDAEKRKMKSAMSPDEAKAFGNKIRMLDSFGIKP